jgi:hypothetical protein
MDDMSVAFNKVNLPSATSVSAAAYLMPPNVLLLLTGVGSYGLRWNFRELVVR